MAKRLSDQHRRYIVTRLACFISPSEVARELKEEFGVEVSRQIVSHYDPTVRQSKGKLKPRWLEIYRRARAEFVSDAGRIGIFHLAYRLTQLDQMERRARRAGNLRLAMKPLERRPKRWAGRTGRKGR